MLAGGSVMAQGIKAHTTPVGGRTTDKGEKGDGGDILRIRKLLGVGRQGLEKTPEYKTSVPRGVKPVGDWAQIMVTYDTASKWIDELVFQYYVLTMTSEDGKKAYSMFKTTARYADIEKGRDHMGTVYLRPNTVKRYGFVVAVGVEISFEGKVVASKSETDPELGSMEEKWWAEDSKVMKSPNVTTRDGYLLERSQTPFALVNIDDYEVSK
jgi:hypothetical protein